MPSVRDSIRRSPSAGTPNTRIDRMESPAARLGFLATSGRQQAPFVLLNRRRSNRPSQVASDGAHQRICTTASLCLPEK